MRGRGRGRALVMFMPLTTKEIKLPTLNSIVCIFLWPHSKICHKDWDDNKAEREREKGSREAAVKRQDKCGKITKFIAGIYWSIDF